MKVKHNIAIEKRKLLMLSNQFMSDKDFSGKILFRSLNNDHFIDSFKFIINDDMYDHLKKSGLRTLLIDLLSEFSLSRHESNITPNNGGVIKIIKNEFDISWLAESEILALFQKPNK